MSVIYHTVMNFIKLNVPIIKRDNKLKDIQKIAPRKNYIFIGILFLKFLIHVFKINKKK